MIFLEDERAAKLVIATVSVECASTSGTRVVVGKASTTGIGVIVGNEASTTGIGVEVGKASTSDINLASSAFPSSPVSE